MNRSDMHYRLYRYLRSPIVDAGGGELVSLKALKVNEYQIWWFKERTLRTICCDEITEKFIEPLFNLLSDGGCLIAIEISDQTIKELRRKYRYQVIKDAPFIIVKRLSGPPGEYPAPKPKPVDGRKKVLMIRYGANGDHLFVSPLIQYYHDEGWHITYNVTERGEQIYRDDPRIDDLLVQETGVLSIKRTDLDAYWSALGKEYDKVIQLNEVMEVDLIRVEGSPEYLDPWEKRDAECDKNVIDYHFERAGLDIKGRLPTIWLSEKEKEWAQKEVEQVRKKLNRKFIVLWNIFGSCWHKAYPGMFEVWMLLQTNRDDIGVLAISDQQGKFVVGNDFGQVVYNGCDRYKFRQSLALHSAVDAVVTPETWSIPAGLAFPAPMIMLLSHSSKKAYTSRPQDIQLQASVKNCPCIECHQLHYSRASCPRGVYNKDATLCMDQLEPGIVYDSLMLLRSRYEHYALTA